MRGVIWQPLSILSSLWQHWTAILSDWQHPPIVLMTQHQQHQSVLSFLWHGSPRVHGRCDALDPAAHGFLYLAAWFCSVVYLAPVASVCAIYLAASVCSLISLAVSVGYFIYLAASVCPSIHPEPTATVCPFIYLASHASVHSFLFVAEGHSLSFSIGWSPIRPHTVRLLITVPSYAVMGRSCLHLGGLAVTVQGAT